MTKGKVKRGRGQHPNSRANLVTGYQGERQYGLVPLCTRLSDELHERFSEAKGTLKDAEALRQAVAFALEQGWKAP